MNIKLSDEEISRWICEKLEPLASLPKPDEFVNRKDRRHGSDPEDAPKYWKMMQRFRSTFEYGWQPRDMVNDPTMTLMLIEKLRKDSHVAVLLGQLDNWVGVRVLEGFAAPYAVDELFDYPVYFEKPAISHRAKTLERAVAETFMLMNGYKAQP